MLRLLLLIPTTTYRTEDFVAAAAKLDVELVVASERPNVLESALPDNLLTLDFGDPIKAARTVAEFARRHPVDAVVPVDDRTTVVGAAIAERLGLRSSSLDAVSTTRNKHRMREAFARAGVRSPRFTLLDVSDDPEAAADRVTYPCVLKPTILAGSRGVIRADDAPSFVAAFRRIAAILGSPDSAELGEGREEVLVEDFIPGREVALEGLLVERGAPRPGALRQARPARRAVLRGDDLRDALAPAPRRPARHRGRGALGGPGARARGGAGPRRAPGERRGAVDDRACRPHDRRPLLAHAALRGGPVPGGAGHPPRARDRARLARAGAESRPAS